MRHPIAPKLHRARRYACAVLVNGRPCGAPYHRGVRASYQHPLGAIVRNPRVVLRRKGSRAAGARIGAPLPIAGGDAR